jgi:hypothetical protein
MAIEAAKALVAPDVFSANSLKIVTGKFFGGSGNANSLIHRLMQYIGKPETRDCYRAARSFGKDTLRLFSCQILNSQEDFFLGSIHGWPHSAARILSEVSSESPRVRLRGDSFG